MNVINGSINLVWERQQLSSVDESWTCPSCTKPNNSSIIIYCPCELESVQKRTARFVTGNYTYETGQLKWESLKNMRKYSRLILRYKGLKGKASILTDDLIPKTRHGRNQHSMTSFQDANDPTGLTRR